MSNFIPRWEALKAVHDQFAKVAIDMFNSGQEVEHQLFIIGQEKKSGVVKTVAAPEDVMRIFLSSDQGKNALSNFMTQLLTEHSPVRESFIEGIGVVPLILIQINEAWALRNPGSEELSRLLSGEVSVSESAAKTEVILVVVHCHGLSIPVQHLIKDAPNRHCVMSEFPSPESVSSGSGKFILNRGPKTGDSIH